MPLLQIEGIDMALAFNYLWRKLREAWFGFLSLTQSGVSYGWRNHRETS